MGVWCWFFAWFWILASNSVFVSVWCRFWDRFCHNHLSKQTQWGTIPKVAPELFLNFNSGLWTMKTIFILHLFNPTLPFIYLFFNVWNERLVMWNVMFWMVYFVCHELEMTLFFRILWWSDKWNIKDMKIFYEMILIID